MKNTIYLLFATLLIISCSNLSEETIEPKIDANLKIGEVKTFNTIQDVKSLNLRTTFNIPQDVYEEFESSIILQDGFVRGAVYRGINNTLNEEDQFNFWSTFGFSTNDEIDAGATFKDFKPKGDRGCKKRVDFICHLPDGPVFETQRADATINSKYELLQAKLNIRFSIPFDTYKEFVESVDFQNGKIRGFIYDELYDHLTDEQLLEFQQLLDIEEDTTFTGYKPVRENDCKKRRRWICVQRGEN